MAFKKWKWNRLLFSLSSRHSILFVHVVICSDIDIQTRWDSGLQLEIFLVAVCCVNIGAHVTGFNLPKYATKMWEILFTNFFLVPEIPTHFDTLFGCKLFHTLSPCSRNEKQKHFTRSIRCASRPNEKNNNKCTQFANTETVFMAQTSSNIVRR